MTPQRFLRLITGLGRVRAVLHNACGLAEVFCDAASFGVRAGRLDIVLPAAHLHLDLGGLTCARLLDAGDDAHPSKRSVVLYGQGGRPAVAFVLDPHEAAGQTRQHATFAALRSQLGDHVSFVEADGQAETRVLH
jgi:hypothetical protein